MATKVNNHINLSLPMLAEKCKAQRLARRLNKSEAARQMYVSSQTYSKIESGRGNISIGVRVDVLRWLNLI